MRSIAIAAALGVAIIATSTAFAGSLGRPCTASPESQWLSLDVLKSRAEAMGFKVQKAKLKGACAEIYATDSKGARAEIFLDPTNGALVGRL